MRSTCAMMKLLRERARRGLPVVLATVIVACGDGSPLRTVGPDDGTFELGVRVHLLSSDFGPLDTSLSDSEVRALLDRANDIWSQAKVEWRLESIVREEATGAADYEALLAGQADFTGELVAGVIPRDALFSGEWDVFFIQDLAGIAGGIYFPDIPAVLGAERDPAGLRDLSGSVSRILAHELGHSLGLPHVPCTSAGNLMSPGCDSRERTRLTDLQIETARGQAATGRPHRG